MTTQEAIGQAFENGRRQGDAEGYARGRRESCVEAGDLISRKTLLEVMERRKRLYGDSLQIRLEYDDVIATITDAAAVDTRPVKHGRWAGCRCSVCDRSALEDEDIDTGVYDIVLSAYCPRCGARMDA